MVAVARRVQVDMDCRRPSRTKRPMPRPCDHRSAPRRRCARDPVRVCATTPDLGAIMRAIGGDDAVVTV
jgi:hypothetical protein